MIKYNTLLSVLIVSLIACPVFAQKAKKAPVKATTASTAPVSDVIQWITVEELEQKMKKEPRLVLIDFYTDWCGWCKVMDRKTFSDAEVGTYMDKHFVSTKIEMEKEETGRMLAKKHGVNLYPTFLILDSKGNLLLRMEGFQGPASFLKTLEDFIKSQK